MDLRGVSPCWSRWDVWAERLLSAYIWVVAAMTRYREVCKAPRNYVQRCRESAIKGVSCVAASPTIAADGDFAGANGSSRRP